MFDVWKALVRFVTWERLLERYANGGDVVTARAAGTAFFAWMLCFLISWLYDTVLHNEVFWDWGAVRHSVHWSATTIILPAFAGVYLALHSRFAEQWKYLAELYNSIKEAEARGIDGDAGDQALVEWKAAFLEDAIDLHLAVKPLFAATFRDWAEHSDIRNAFDMQASDEQRKRLRDLLSQIPPRVPVAPQAVLARKPDLERKLTRRIEVLENRVAVVEASTATSRAG